MVISFATDEARPLPRSTRCHIERCAACRQFYESQWSIAGQLAADAEPKRQNASPFLHAKIMARLNRQPAAAGGGRSLLSGWPAAAATAVALLCAGLIWWQGPPSQNRHGSQGRAEIAATATELSTLIRVPSEVKLTNWSQTLNQPLETELELVVSDARTALTYLADNFLPEQLRESAFRANQ